MDSELKYALAFSLVKGVGDITAKRILSYVGSFEKACKLSVNELSKIEGIGIIRARNIYKEINSERIAERVKEELEFIEKNNIEIILYPYKNYPLNLKQCEDGPILLYSKGKFSLKGKKILSVVGTRNITDYGKRMIEKILLGFNGLDIIVVSGLAYGVDSYVHKTCVENGLETVGVLAHGLDRIYPSINLRLAGKMVENGGLLTDFMSGTNPDRENFPKRNRIIAGLADATLVIESAKKGGSLITAEIANSYSRDVFALPGKVGEETSEGCNYLIKNNKAHLVDSAQDIINMMGWEINKEQKKVTQKSLFAELSEEEILVAECIENESPKHIDQLVAELNSTNSKLAMILLEMEFKGVVRALPGKMYRLN